MSRAADSTAGPDRVDAAGQALDRASVLPAMLAALAESAVIYLPLHDVAVNEGRVIAGPMVDYSLFLLVFACGVAVATWRRGSSRFLPAVAASAVAIGVVQGILWGTGDAVTATASVVLWLLVAARVFTLALRDWRDPIGTSFGVGSGALLVEIISMGGFAEARAVLPFAVTQFFLASLASRAASLRLSARQVTIARAEPTEEGQSGRGLGGRIGMGLLAIAALGLLMAVAVVLGGRHGGLFLLGKAILSVVLPVLAYLLAPVIRLLVEALMWLFGLIHIDLSSLRSLARTIDKFRARPPEATSPGGGVVGRVFALLLLLALGYLLVRTIRMRWLRFERKGPADEERPEAMPVSAFSPRRRRWGRRTRQELPADTVRRWYAEALLILDRLGLPKAPSRTPGEYLRDVTFAFPECAAGFTALTRAYEDVRYGSRTFEGDTLEKLEANRRLAMSALSKADRLEEAPGEEGT